MRPILASVLFIVALGAGINAQTYSCPMAGSPQIRQGDSEAKSGGRVDSTRAKGKQHGGLDLNGAVGDIVLAARDGRVAVANPAWKAMGGTVIIDHGDGDYTVYGHMDTVTTKLGVIKAGTQVGTVGYTGNAASLKKAGLPPHLHFALIKAGKTKLADVGGPLQQMQNWADYWQDLGADITGPVNPGLFFPANCWKGSTTVGAPDEK